MGLAPAQEARLLELEPVLRRALVAAYGPETGRDAAAEALLWACQHSDELERIGNLAGYLYRVGQTAARRVAVRSPATVASGPASWPGVDERPYEPGLAGALANLSTRQREVVLLIKAYQYTPTEVAALLECSVSSVRVHLARGLDQLRLALKVTHD
jgi:DNA-directed RNA polymerase specialized sigma24 family protein